MRICYLPVFLALSLGTVLNVSAQHLRVVPDVSSATEMVAMMSTIMSMMVPTEVLAMFTESFEQIFSDVPVDFTKLDPSTLGRRRRASFPWETQVAKERSSKSLQRNLNGVPETLMETFFPFVNFNGNKEDVSMISTVSLKRRFSRSPEGGEEAGDPSAMATSAMETGMAGMEMVSKGVEGGQNGAKAVGDLAESGKSGAEGLASGAEMMSKAAETAGNGMKEGQDIASGMLG